MAETMVSCPACGFPVMAHFEGENLVCANCGQKMEVVKASPLSRLSSIGRGIGFFPFLLGLGIGIFFGPSIISTSKGGRAWLEKTAREAEARLKE